MFCVSTVKWHVKPYPTTTKAYWLTYLCVTDDQDKLRMFGAKVERHVILFKRALLVAKKRDDVTMSVKVFIEVTIPHKNDWQLRIHKEEFS